MSLKGWRTDYSCKKQLSASFIFFEIILESWSYNCISLRRVAFFKDQQYICQIILFKGR